LALGLVGVVLLVGPRSLPESAAVIFIPLALSASLFYAAEGNIVARWGTQGADAIQVLLGASLFGLVMSVPFALLTGSWITPRFPLGVPDAALIVSAIAHTTVYCAYVWMLGRTGAVFTSQVGYLVTGFGIFWAMLILGETYAGPVWIALALVMAGVALVQPRDATR
jgi:drug/metabolite transporter (DMT)-like permease